MCLGRSGFRRDLAPPKTEDAGLQEAASSVAFGILKAGVRGESPSYQDVVLVGAALAATLTSSKMGGSGLGGAASSVAFGILEAGVRG